MAATFELYKDRAEEYRWRLRLAPLSFRTALASGLMKVHIMETIEEIREAWVHFTSALAWVKDA